MKRGLLGLLQLNQMLEKEQKGQEFVNGLSRLFMETKSVSGLQSPPKQ